MNAAKRIEIKQNRSEWEGQYQRGRWDFLAGEQEFARYALISAILRRLPGPLSLFDAGCGQAILRNHLGTAFVSKYTGLDIAQSALDKVEPKRACDRLICSTLEEYEPDDKWDAIVFNEVLYYTSDPVAQIQKFEKSLNAGGILLVSIYKKPRFWSYNNRCARRVKHFFMQANYKIIDAVEIGKIYTGARWQIFVVRPPVAASQ